jgi:hypothetical protein
MNARTDILNMLVGHRVLERADHYRDDSPWTLRQRARASRLTRRIGQYSRGGPSCARGLNQ